MIKIVLADDHSLVRIGVRKVLEAANIQVVAEASNGEEALEMIQKNEPDIAILDIAMPRKTGMEVALELLRMGNPARTIMLSMHSNREFARQALAAGANGYVPKQSAPEEICIAVRKVHSGGTYLSNSLTDGPQKGSSSSHHSSAADDRLSVRQRQVLVAIGQGHSISEIAQILGIGEKTVETHRSRLMQQLGLKNSRELMQYAVQQFTE